MLTLDDMIARADKLAGEAKELARDLRAMKALEKKSGGPALKQEDGKLTEKGVRVLEAALAAEETPSDIARSLGISVPAVLYRKRIWEGGRK